MIRTTITPNNKIFPLPIPEEYIGKQVEVLFYTADEGKEEKGNTKQSMSDFCGVLSENDYQALKNYSQKTRKEWNRNI
jgi:hypothetical protein